MRAEESRELRASADVLPSSGQSMSNSPPMAVDRELYVYRGSWPRPGRTDAWPDGGGRRADGSQTDGRRADGRVGDRWRTEGGRADGRAWKCVQNVCKILPPTLARARQIRRIFEVHFGHVRNVCKMCAKCVQNVCKLCAKCVQNVCKMCAKCVQNVMASKICVWLQAVPKKSKKRRAIASLLQKVRTPLAVLRPSWLRRACHEPPNCYRKRDFRACAKCVQNVCKMCAKCVQHVCKMCAKCVQNVCTFLHIFYTFFTHFFAISGFP